MHRNTRRTLKEVSLACAHDCSTQACIIPGAVCLQGACLCLQGVLVWVVCLQCACVPSFLPKPKSLGSGREGLRKSSHTHTPGGWGPLCGVVRQMFCNTCTVCESIGHKRMEGICGHQFCQRTCFCIAQALTMVTISQVVGLPG